MLRKYVLSRHADPGSVSAEQEKIMKTITLYQKGKSTFDGWKSWWSANDKLPGIEFEELTDHADFKIPEIWTHVYIDGNYGNTLEFSAEFATDDGREGYLYTNKHGDPVIVDVMSCEHYPLRRITDEN